MSDRDPLHSLDHYRDAVREVERRAQESAANQGQSVVQTSRTAPGRWTSRCSA